MDSSVHRIAAGEAEPSATPSTDLFRKEALQHHVQGQAHGDLLRISPAWTHRAAWILAGLVGAALLLSIVGRVNEYASGRAMVRFADRVDLTALTSGTCTSLDAQPGDRVRAGQVLVRFYAGPEAAELERIEHDFDLLLVELLANPADHTVRQSLAKLRSERNWALGRLEEQHRRAPCDGVVGDVRVRAGQFVQAGDVFLTLNRDSLAAAVVALLPGRFGPDLHAGMDLRLELDGFPYAYQHVRLTGVSSEVLGPAAAQRMLGREAGEALQVEGPVVVATATLAASTFRSRGVLHPFRDGMQGTAEVRVRSERILLALIPGLRAAREERHE